jgi:GTP-binding protein EngB required for normal cell division
MASRIPPPKSRCPDKAYVILLGLTGGGKSATINFLFNNEQVTTPDSYASATSTILEYSVKIPINIKGVKECELRVIDTPGFGDTRQKPLVRDACFVATMEKFLEEHEDLKKGYPTTVLLVAKFNDDRIDGETSNFIQMLKGIDKLLKRLIDREACNLIFVLTHTMSEETKELQVDPRPKIRLIESLVKTFTKLPTPIDVVLAENKPHLSNLPERRGFYKLPNGQYYPKNLFQEIQKIAVRSNDHVGETIIREAFKDPSKLKITLHREISLLDPKNIFVQSAFTALQEARFNIEDTYISRELKRQWESLDENFRKPYFNSLQIVQSTFHKKKILGEDDIPKTRNGILNLLAELPLNLPVVSVLEKMGIVAPTLPNSLGIGYFYNIFTDSMTSNSPFKLDDISCSEIGYKLLTGVRAQAIQEVVQLVMEYDKTNSYLHERLTALNVDGAMQRENFTAETRTGHNILTPNTNRITGIREDRVFRISIRKKIPVSDNFMEEVYRLPNYEDGDKISRAVWRLFFQKYGTHVVDSVYGGGSIEVIATKKIPGKTSLAEHEKVIRLVREILKNLGTINKVSVDDVSEDWKFDIHFKGGDPHLSPHSLATIFSKAGVDFIRVWKESLPFHPIMLQSEIMLESLPYYVEVFCNQPRSAKQIELAMEGLFANTFYRPKTPDDVPARVDTLPPRPKSQWGTGCVIS